MSSVQNYKLFNFPAPFLEKVGLNKENPIVKKASQIFQEGRNRYDDKEGGEKLKASTEKRQKVLRIGFRNGMESQSSSTSGLPESPLIEPATVSPSQETADTEGIVKPDQEFWKKYDLEKDFPGRQRYHDIQRQIKEKAERGRRLEGTKGIVDRIAEETKIEYEQAEKEERRKECKRFFACRGSTPLFLADGTTIEVDLAPKRRNIGIVTELHDKPVKKRKKKNKQTVQPTSTSDKPGIKGERRFGTGDEVD